MGFLMTIEPLHDKINNFGLAPSEDLVQPEHPPIHIRLSAGPTAIAFSMQTVKTDKTWQM